MVSEQRQRDPSAVHSMQSPSSSESMLASKAFLPLPTQLSTPTLLYGLKALKKLHMCHFASYALKSQRKCHEALKRKCYQASERSASRPAQKVPSGLHRKSGKPAQHFQCSSSGAGHITKNWESMASFKRFWQKKKKKKNQLVKKKSLYSL